MNAEMFAALSHELRLEVFRLLIGALPEGLAAGEIAQRLEVPPSTLSTHLAQLERVGLLKSRRERQRIVYNVDSEGTKNLVGFLVNDCCQGQPELCGYPAGRSKPARKKQPRRS